MMSLDALSAHLAVCAGLVILLRSVCAPTWARLGRVGSCLLAGGDTAHPGTLLRPSSGAVTSRAVSTPPTSGLQGALRPLVRRGISLLLFGVFAVLRLAMPRAGKDVGSEGRRRAGRKCEPVRYSGELWNME